MVVVADEAVIIVVIPKSADALESEVDFAGSEVFPGTDDLVERAGVEAINEDVDVVGHDAPLEELVAGAIEVPEVLDDDGGVCRIAEVAGSVALVFVACDEAVEFDLAFVVVEVLELGFPLFGDFLGDGVGKAVGDGLTAVGDVEMGKVAAFVPAFESIVVHGIGACDAVALGW